MLNRAYEVLRDPVLKKSYDLFGTRGIGTSAASDVENVARRSSQTNQKPRPSTWPSSSSTSSTSTSGRSTGSYSGGADFGSNWQTGSSTSSSNRNGNNIPVDGKGVGNASNGFGGDYSRAGVVDPNQVGNFGNPSRQKRASDTFQTDPTFSEKDTPFDSWTWSSSKKSRDYKAGPKPMDEKAYFGDMGSVHAQPRSRTSFEDNLFIPHDGSPLTGGEAFFGRGPKFGRDVLIDVEVDATIAKLGGKKSIQVKHMKTCSKCNGVGTQDTKSTITTCRHCGGSGHTIGASQMRETCPACFGTGRIIRNPCQSCHGLGFEETTKSLEIVIPKRTDHGYTLRIPGEGDAGPNGGPSGDLYVCFQISGAKETPASNPVNNDTTKGPPVNNAQSHARKAGPQAPKVVALEPDTEVAMKPSIRHSGSNFISKTSSRQPSSNVSMKHPNGQPSGTFSVKTPSRQTSANVSMKPPIRPPPRSTVATQPPSRQTIGPPSVTVSIKSSTRQPSPTVVVKPSSRQPSGVVSMRPPVGQPRPNISTKTPIRQSSTTVPANPRSPDPMTKATTDLIDEQPTRRRRRDRIGGFFGGIMSNLLSK